MATSPVSVSLLPQDRPIDPAVGRSRRRRQLLLIAAILAAALCATAWTLRSWLTATVVVPRARVRIATVTRGHFISDVAAQGTVVAAVSPTLYAPAAGTVILKVKAGDPVTRGQLLASLDSPSVSNQFARERATLEGLEVALQRQQIEMRRQQLQNQQTSDLAKVTLDAAEREYARMQDAYDKGALSKRDLDRSGDELTSARLNYAHAQQNAQMQRESLAFELRAKQFERDRQRLTVGELQQQVDQLSIRSPVTGMVGSLAVGDRAAVANAAALLTVVDLSALEIEFRVPESYAGLIKRGLHADVTLGTQHCAATVTSIAPEVRDAEVSGRVRFDGEPPPGLRQNQRVAVAVVLDSRDGVLKVERGAFADAGGSVYVVSGNRVTRHQVRLGATSVGEVEILDGLQAGDDIVVTDATDFKNAATARLSD